MTQNDKKWAQIAEQQSNTFFNASKTDLKNCAKKYVAEISDLVKINFN